MRPGPSYGYIWAPFEAVEGSWDADHPMGFIGTSLEDDGTVSWCVQIEDLIEGEAANDALARVDAHNALVAKLENVLAELKGKAVSS